MRRWLLALALLGMLVASGCSLCAAIDDCDDCCHDCDECCCDCGCDCCD